MPSRTRDKGANSSVTFSRETRQKSTGALVSKIDTPFPFRNADLMVDFVTPNFQKKSRDGAIINSPMTKVKSTYIDLGASGSHEGPATRLNYLHYVQWIPTYEWALSQPAVDAKIARVEALAITEAYSKVGEADMQTLTELAELRETVKFLWSPVKAMISYTNKGRRWLDRANRRDASYQRALTRYNLYKERWLARPPKRRGREPLPPSKPKYPPLNLGGFKVTDIPSFWLGFRYGLMPLLYSFQDAQKALNGILAKAPPRATVRGGASEGFSATIDRYPPVSNANIAGGIFDARYTGEVDLSISSRAGVLFAPQLDFKTTWGLHLHQVPAALYEAVPLSFVADWFWTGMKAYQALTASLRAKQIMAAWVTTTVFGTVTNVDYFTPKNATSSGTGSFASGFVDFEWTRRRPASLADVRVQLEIELNADRIADGLSLIYLFISGRGKR